MRPDDTRMPEFSACVFSSSVASFFFRNQSRMARMTPPAKTAEVVENGQVHADRDQHRRRRLDEDQRDAEEHADDDQRPRHLAADDALRHERHEPGLRRRQLGRADGVGLVEDHEQHRQGERRRDDADDLADLHPPRRTAEDVADLEVLHHVAGDTRRRSTPRRRPRAPPPRPCTPVTPISTMSTAEMTSADRVRPEIGLLELPTRPTR